MKYEIPQQYFFRLHHIRPRFKNNLERVIRYLANEISNLGEMDRSDFIRRVNTAIREFPGNQTWTDKTVNNWRTEISSLFGFIVKDERNKTMKPSKVASMVAEGDDLVGFFKFFCYTFQFPGGHLKNFEVKKIIEAGVRFKPALFILQLLLHGNSREKNFWLTNAEVTHCIFNDLRVTRDRISPETVYNNIKGNRLSKIKYDVRGDIIRYAKDILDYMDYANLLIKHGSRYYLNTSENETIQFFLNPDNEVWFDGFDDLYGNPVPLQQINAHIADWFRYLSNLADKTKFKTDIISFLNLDKEQFKRLEALEIEALKQDLASLLNGEEIEASKQIGDAGEAIAYGHECERLKRENKPDLVKKVVILPNNLKMGYDIRSFNTEDLFRHIEVKTTISNSAIDYFRIAMTPNEWNAATSYKDLYYVYRLGITRKGARLFIIRDPVKNFSDKKIKMRMLSGGGAELELTRVSGNYEDILTWTG